MENVISMNTKINAAAMASLDHYIKATNCSKLDVITYLALSKKVYASNGIKLSVNKKLCSSRNKSSNYWLLTKGNSSLTLTSSQLVHPSMLLESINILNRKVVTVTN